MNATANLPAGVTQGDIDGPEQLAPWTWDDWAAQHAEKATEFDREWLGDNGTTMVEELEDERGAPQPYLRHMLTWVRDRIIGPEDFDEVLRIGGVSATSQAFFRRWDAARERHAEAQPRD